MSGSLARGGFGRSPFSLHKRNRTSSSPLDSPKALRLHDEPRPMAPSTIVIVGALNTDLVTVMDRVPDVGETLSAKHYSEHFGGKGANTSIAAYRLSHSKPGAGNVSRYGSSISPLEDIRIRMIGRVGDDARGPPLIDNPKDNGVDTSGVQQVPGEMTGICIALVESESGYSGVGENRLLIHAGANHSLKAAEFKSWETFGGSSKPDLLISQLEIPRDTVTQILDTANKNGIETLLNPSPVDWLPSDIYKTVAHLVVNQMEANALKIRPTNGLDDEKSWTSIAEDFIEMGVENVVITLGAKGAYYSTRLGDRNHVQAEPNVKVKDTTGAGDTFTGAYAADVVRQKQYGKDWDIKHAVELGCRAAAWTIKEIGAQESVPWLDEVAPGPR